MSRLGSQIIDVALGLALVFLALSLVCSLAQELLATGLSWRARFLERGLQAMLRDGDRKGRLKRDAEAGGDLLDQVLDSPFVKEKLKRGRILGRDVDVPAYLPSSTFGRAVIDALDGSLVIPDSVPPPIRRKLEILAKEAGGDLVEFRKGLEEWFDATMDRVSAWYKRRARMVLFAVGLLVAAGTNADLIDVSDRLWRDGAVRAAVVAQADRAAQSPSLGPLTAETRRELERTGDVVASVKQFDLPLWWNDGNGRPGDLAVNPGPGEESLLSWLLGIVLTACALSFGAPFWFNLLSRLARLRGGRVATARE